MSGFGHQFKLGSGYLLRQHSGMADDSGNVQHPDDDERRDPNFIQALNGRGIWSDNGRLLRLRQLKSVQLHGGDGFPHLGVYLIRSALGAIQPHTHIELRGRR